MLCFLHGTVGTASIQAGALGRWKFLLFNPLSLLLAPSELGHVLATREKLNVFPSPKCASRTLPAIAQLGLANSLRFREFACVKPGPNAGARAAEQPRDLNITQEESSGQFFPNANGEMKHGNLTEKSPS
jgi:hypothetical protein